MRLVGLPLLPGSPVPAPQQIADNAFSPVMFRGDPAHTGVAAGTLFDGQGGVRWRVR